MLVNTNFKNILCDDQITPLNDVWAQQPQNHRGFRVARARHPSRRRSDQHILRAVTPTDQHTDRPAFVDARHQ